MAISLTILEINNRKPNESLLTAVTAKKGKRRPNGRAVRHIACRCVCGKTTIVTPANILSGQVLSCGCLLEEAYKKAKWAKYHPRIVEIYSCYSGMINRCYHKKHPAFSYYGGRGVRVCDEWRNSYQAFLDWSLANGWQKGLELDKDKKGDGMLYSPESCCYITHLENMNNIRSNVKYMYNGELIPLSEISRRSGIGYITLRTRLNKGRTIEESINFKRKKYIRTCKKRIFS